MKDAAVIILSIYALANAGIIWYFFVYKMNQADKEYEKRLTRIIGKRLTG
jgi:hypothetical protein